MPPITINKKYGYTASVLNDSNKVIACSKADWNAVRDGSFIIMNADTNFYKVIGKKKFIYQKEAVVLNSLQIKINEPVGAMISVDDDISFAYSEYSLIDVSVKDSGEGYQVGDVLRPEGGTYKYNSIDQIDSPAQIEVESVGDGGNILSAKLINGGLYSTPPTDVCPVASDLGSGATFNVTSKVSDITSIEDRTVESVDFESDHAVLHLNHPLPPRLTAGNIKVEKWELTLDNNYSNQSKYSTAYEIIKDFTPHNNIPLMRKDLSAGYLMYNEAMAIIDQRLKDLEDKS